MTHNVVAREGGERGRKKGNMMNGQDFWLIGKYWHLTEAKVSVSI